MISTLVLMLVFFLLGVMLYYIDSLALKRMNKDKGLIVGRLIVWRAVGALVIVLLLEFKLSHGKDGFQDEIVYGFLEFIGLLLGFYLAVPFLKWVPGKMRAVLQYAKNAEAGNVNPIQDMKEKISETGAELKNKSTHMVVDIITTPVDSNQTESSLPNESEKIIQAEPSSVEETVVKEKKDSAEDLKNALDKYTNNTGN